MNTQTWVLIIVFIIIVALGVITACIVVFRKRKERAQQLKNNQIEQDRKKLYIEQSNRLEKLNEYFTKIHNNEEITIKENKYLNGAPEESDMYYIEPYEKNINDLKKYLEDNHLNNNDEFKLLITNLEEFILKYKDISKNPKKYENFGYIKNFIAKTYNSWNYPVDSFVDFLYDICQILYDDYDENSGKILEIAAGNGFISSFIKYNAMLKKKPISIRATDYMLETYQNYVYKVDNESALYSVSREYKPTQILLVSRGRSFMNKELLVAWINNNIQKTIVLILLSEGPGNSCEPPEFFGNLKTLGFTEHIFSLFLLPFDSAYDGVFIYTRYNDKKINKDDIPNLSQNELNEMF